MVMIGASYGNPSAPKICVVGHVRRMPPDNDTYPYEKAATHPRPLNSWSSLAIGDATHYENIIPPRSAGRFNDYRSGILAESETYEPQLQAF